MICWPDGTPKSTDNFFNAVPITAPTEPPKRKHRRSKLEQSVIALDTPEERKQRRETRHYNIISFSPNPQADADKSARISGKGNNRRSV